MTVDGHEPWLLPFLTPTDTQPPFSNSFYTHDIDLLTFGCAARMARLRREFRDDNSHQYSSPSGKQLRIVASGTLFLTHTLSLPCHPAPSTMIRAHSVDKARGGSANMVCFLALLTFWLERLTYEYRVIWVSDIDSVIASPILICGSRVGSAAWRK